MKDQYQLRDMGPMGSRLVDTTVEPELIIGRPTPEILLATLNAQARAAAALRELAIDREMGILSDRESYLMNKQASGVALNEEEHVLLEQIQGAADYRELASHNIDLVVASAKTGHESYSESMAAVVRQPSASPKTQPTKVIQLCETDPPDGSEYQDPPPTDPDGYRMGDVKDNFQPTKVIGLGCESCGFNAPIARSLGSARSGCNVCEPEQHCLGCGERGRYPFCGTCNVVAQRRNGGQDLIDADRKQRGVA